MNMLTCVVSDPRTFTSIAIAPAKDAEIIALEAAQWNGLDDGCRYCAQEQQHEGQKEYYRQRRCGSQHSGWSWSESNECSVAAVVGRATACLEPREGGGDAADGERDQTHERRGSSMRKNVS